MRTLLILLAISLFACEKSQEQLRSETNHIVVPNTSIFSPDTLTYYEFQRVESPDSLLLEARRHVNQHPEALHGGATHVLVLPLDNQRTSFSYAEEELIGAGVFITLEDCFCSTNTVNVISGGFISGTLQADGSWVVDGEITAELPFDGEIVWDVSGIYR